MDPGIAGALSSKGTPCLPDACPGFDIEMPGVFHRESGLLEIYVLFYVVSRHLRRFCFCFAEVSPKTLFFFVRVDITFSFWTFPACRSGREFGVTGWALLLYYCGSPACTRLGLYLALGPALPSLVEF